ncbi:MAG TPA: hypothetical protein VFA98_16570 [Thermoanaerobaculia bacterium]|jgi:hypothetical protein|nr:hypothetical protein [Thermoanaerobaculia bacterium]
MWLFLNWWNEVMLFRPEFRRFSDVCAERDAGFNQGNGRGGRPWAMTTMTAMTAIKVTDHHLASFESVE